MSFLTKLFEKNYINASTLEQYSNERDKQIECVV